jgi:hypothetical protein
LACAKRAPTAGLGFVVRRQVESRMGVQTEVDSSNGLDDVMMGDDECSVGMQDRAGMGITKWLAQLAQLAQARQGKVWFGPEAGDQHACRGCGCPGCRGWRQLKRQICGADHADFGHFLGGAKGGCDVWLWAQDGAARQVEWGLGLGMRARGGGGLGVEARSGCWRRQIQRAPRQQQAGRYLGTIVGTVNGRYNEWYKGHVKKVFPCLVPVSKVSSSSR